MTATMRGSSTAARLALASLIVASHGARLQRGAVPGAAAGLGGVVDAPPALTPLGHSREGIEEHGSFVAPAVLLEAAASTEGGARFRPMGRLTVATAMAGAAALVDPTAAFAPGQSTSESSGVSKAGVKGMPPVRYRNEAVDQSVATGRPAGRLAWQATSGAERAVLQHFDYPALIASGANGYEVFTCRARGTERHLEVHAMPLRNGRDREAFKAQIIALRGDAASYLGWRREVDDLGDSYGLLVTEAARARLSDVHLDPNFEDKVWERFKVAVQVSKSLLSMYEAGFVHGRVNPGSVWVSMDPRGRFVDAVLSHPDPAIEWGNRARTPRQADEAFLAPEVRGGSGKFSDKADVYGLGALIYSLLVGHPPGHDWQRSEGFQGLIGKRPMLGYLVLDLMASDAGNRPNLRQAAARIEGLYGAEPSEELNHVARDDRRGLPPLCTRASRAAALFERICRLIG